MSSRAPSPSLASRRRSTVAAAFVLAALACSDSGTGPAAFSAPDGSTLSRGEATFPATPSVFATGLEYPRGLAFGPDGDLYVAEAGHAGTGFTTPAQCTQVQPPVGPYTNGLSSRISRIDRRGTRTVFATGFPSGRNAFGDVLGVADVAFIGNTLYALSSGGGCSHGTVTSPAGIARVSRSGAWSIVSDLSAWEAANVLPVANRTPDFEPDGSWYGMIASDGGLIAAEPNQGYIVRTNVHSGAVSLLSAVWAQKGHIVPTVLAERRGALYMSHLGTFPAVPGTQKIFRVAPSGALSVVAEGFTAVLGLDFDRHGRLYVLETTVSPVFPTPGTGRVVRLDAHGGRTVVVSGLTWPTGIRIGPDGRLYISNKGFSFGPPQPGEILRVDLRDDGRDDEDMEHGDG